MIRYRKITAILLTFSLLFLSASPISVSYAAELKGTCGAKCSYTLSEDGVLTISGTGTITKKFDQDEKINKKIKSVVIEDGIEKIGDNCFDSLGTSPDEKIVISLAETITEIGDEALVSPRIAVIELPSGLKKLGKNAFELIGMEKIVIPESTKEIGDWTFYDSDVKEVVLPRGLQTLSVGMFAGCKKLTNLQLPLQLETIKEYAFARCSFTKFEIPDTVKTVEKHTFDSCSKLQNIIIGKSVKKIDEKFASNCIALKTITNHSKITIPLDTMSGKRSWYVGKKKATKLAPGKTATAKLQKYKIKYNLDGGKVLGKKPVSYQYHQQQKLPQKVKKKGYTFVGWYISAKNDWELFPNCITEKLYGNLTANAIFKKYRVTSTKGRIHVTVKDAGYGKKGYNKEEDAYYFRYSEKKDMSDARIHLYTAPYGDGLSPKLKKGKTYYVEITRHVAWYMEDSEDLEEPFCGWHCKRKVRIQ